MTSSSGRSPRASDIDVASFVAIVPDPLLLVDVTTRVVKDANDGAADLTGYGRDEIVAERVDILTPKEPVQGVAPRSWAQLLGAPGRYEEVPLQRRDGSRFVGSASVSILSLPASPPRTEALVFLRDPTARRLLERDLIEKHMALREAYEDLAQAHVALEEKNRQLEEQRLVVSRLEQMATIGRFAAGVAHEINNPLAFVLENLHLLQEHAGYLQPILDRELRRKHQPRIERIAAELQDMLVESILGAERVRDIVRQIYAFSNTQNQRRELLALEEVVESAIMMVRNQIRQVARLEREYVESPRVRGVAGQLAQVAVNLLVNAIHAVEETTTGGGLSRGRITLRIRPLDDKVCFEVEDSGVGIEKETLAHVFEPFFTTKSAGKGTGLGLSLSSTLVQQHGGSLELFSELGKGTVARVILPRGERCPEDDEVIPSEIPVASERRLKVLFIDDEELLLRALARRFRADHDIVTAGTPETAREALEHRGPFDLVLIDMMMPEMSGPELLEDLLVEYPWIYGRVAFMSGGVFSDRVKSSLDLRGVRVFAKPIDVDLRQLLARAREGIDES